MSTSSDNNYNSNFHPTSQCSGQGFPYMPFSNNDSCYSLFHPPSPLVMSFEEESMFFPYLQNLETQSQSLTTEDNNGPIIAEEKVDDSETNKKMRKSPGKKSSKKDRHRKIVTSQGPRGRRMRLSLEVAPKFFGLHEMLGFNKASKTLEWLLDKSQSAIMEISKQNSGAIKTSSTPSESEVISDGVVERKNESNSLSCPNEKRRKTKVGRVYRPTFTKISREKARERARERTSTKNKLRINESRSA